MATKDPRQSAPSQSSTPAVALDPAAPGSGSSALGRIAPGSAASGAAPPAPAQSSRTPAPEPVTALPRIPSDPVLTPEQRCALECLALGRSIKAASLEAGVARSTLYRWLSEDADFRAVYNAWRQEIEFSTRHRLAGLANKACDVVGRALDASDARTAITLLKGLAYLSPSPAGPTDPARVQRGMDFESIRDDTRMSQAEYNIGDRRRHAGFGLGFQNYQEAADERRQIRHLKQLPKPKEKKDG